MLRKGPVGSNPTSSAMTTRIVDLRKQKKKEEEPPTEFLGGLKHRQETTPSKKIEEPLVVPKTPEPEITLPEPEAEPVKSAPRFEWEAPSFYYNPQKKYLALVVIALMAGATALLFYDQDTLLAIFLMLSSLVLVLYANKKPDVYKIKVGQAGVSIGNRMYYYKELKSFWLDYNPHGPKELSLEARKWYLPHIKVSIEKEDPLELRSLMINFVPEKMHEKSLVDLIARKLGL